MTLKPFLKWAGGKRWLVDRKDFRIPPYTGNYIEPFLGSGAVFFHHCPMKSIISDANEHLILTYQAIADDWEGVYTRLESHHIKHNRNYYYTQRDYKYVNNLDIAAQFLYLNRTCWNGLYRVNKNGNFNVPIGTKTNVILKGDNFSDVSKVLQRAKIVASDFEPIINEAKAGDFIFVDPPYTTSHNFNGFIKYNQNIFRWEDQIRLRDCLVSAQKRGALIMITNAFHESVRDLYSEYSYIFEIERPSIISGLSKGRANTSEALIYME